MKVVENSPSDRFAECLKEGVEIDLEEKHMVWFDEEMEKPSENQSHAKAQANTGNTGEIN